MQVQLHPFALRSGILPLLHGPGHHGVGLEHHFIFKPVFNQLALNLQNRADFYIVQNRLGLSRFQEAADSDGVGVVGHVKFDHPSVALFQLLVVYIEYPALYNHRTHIQTQVLHGNRAAFKGFSVEGITGCLGFGLGSLFCLGGCNRGQGLNHGIPHGGHGIKQCFAFQGFPRFDLNGHRRSKPFPQDSLHLGNQLLQLLFSVGHQVNGQLRFFPFPLGPGQAAPGHGIAADKKLHQLLRLDFVQLIFRMGGRQIYPAQAVQAGNLLSHFLQLPLGDVGIRMDCHMY